MNERPRRPELNLVILLQEEQTVGPGCGYDSILKKSRNMVLGCLTQTKNTFLASTEAVPLLQEEQKAGRTTTRFFRYLKKMLVCCPVQARPRHPVLKLSLSCRKSRLGLGPGYNKIFKKLENMLLSYLVQKRPCLPVLKLSLFCRKNKLMSKVGAMKRFWRCMKNTLLGCLVQKRPCQPVLKQSLS